MLLAKRRGSRSYRISGQIRLQQYKIIIIIVRATRFSCFFIRLRRPRRRYAASTTAVAALTRRRRRRRRRRRAWRSGVGLASCATAYDFRAAVAAARQLGHTGAMGAPPPASGSVVRARNRVTPMYRSCTVSTAPPPRTA